MRTSKLAVSLSAVVAAIGLGPVATQAHEAEEVKVDFEQAISSIPGKSLVVQVVSYPPGAKSMFIATPGRPLR